jgi:hypothetical protein
VHLPTSQLSITNGCTRFEQSKGPPEEGSTQAAVDGRVRGSPCHVGVRARPSRTAPDLATSPAAQPAPGCSSSPALAPAPLATATPALPTPLPAPSAPAISLSFGPGSVTVSVTGIANGAHQVPVHRDCTGNPNLHITTLGEVFVNPDGSGSRTFWLAPSRRDRGFDLLVYPLRASQGVDDSKSPRTVPMSCS